MKNRRKCQENPHFGSDNLDVDSPIRCKRNFLTSVKPILLLTLTCNVILFFHFFFNFDIWAERGEFYRNDEIIST